MATTTRNALIATPLVMAAIALILFSTLRSHTIDKRDLADLWGCYSVEGKPLFTLTPDALVTPIARLVFTARQGRRKAYLDLASPMRLTQRNGVMVFDRSPQPTGPIEVHRSSPRALLLPSEQGVPIEAFRSECHP